LAEEETIPKKEQVHKEVKLIQQIYNQSIEEPYFWIMNWFKDDNRNSLYVTPEEDAYKYFDKSVVKISDVFTASESSSYFGSQAQRLGIQQDKASNYLAVIGKMIKEIFQLVREMRILDERLTYYRESEAGGKDALSSEITLKGMYVDLVEGGAKNPASVYGMASQVGFVTLPDLFFRAMKKKGESVEEIVERDYGKFNEKVKEVLKRKLKQYYTWKDRTHSELGTRRRFTLSYLKQHNQIIRMYMAWVRPYLRQIERLTMHDFASSAELIAGMEQAILEIEVIVKLSSKKTGKYIPCTHLHFFYRTAPQMAYTEEYQKGPAHMGRMEITFRALTLTEEDIEKMKEQKLREDYEMLGRIDSSVKEALEGMGEELDKYLKEADEEKRKKEEEEKKKEEKEKEKKKPLKAKVYKSLFGEPKEGEAKTSMVGPFVELFKGVAQLTDALTGVSKLMKPKEKAEDEWTMSRQKKAAKEAAVKLTYITFHIFKKAHGMITW
jgi:hypothetical protein